VLRSPARLASGICGEHGADQDFYTVTRLAEMIIRCDQKDMRLCKLGQSERFTASLNEINSMEGEMVGFKC